MVFRVSKRDGGDFIAGALMWDVLKNTARHNTTIPTSVDLTDCVHLKPYSVACLAALGARANRSIPLILPTDDNCREHLTRLGLHQWFVATEQTCQQNLRRTNIAIKQLANAPGSFSDEAMLVWETELGGLSAGMRQTFSNHLDEIIFNALGHSRSPVGCFVVGQAFPTEGFVDVSILDLGITILRHIRRNPIYARITRDVDAIRLAFKEGVTGTPTGRTNLLGQPNSGVGLTEISQFCESGNGVISVISGAACITRSHRGEDMMKIHEPFQGTLVNIRFYGRI